MLTVNRHALTHLADVPLLLLPDGCLEVRRQVPHVPLHTSEQVLLRVFLQVVKLQLQRPGLVLLLRRSASQRDHTATDNRIRTAALTKSRLQAADRVRPEAPTPEQDTCGCSQCLKPHQKLFKYSNIQTA
jgi:hypothetical protein